MLAKTVKECFPSPGTPLRAAALLACLGGGYSTNGEVGVAGAQGRLYALPNHLG